MKVKFYAFLLVFIIAPCFSFAYTPEKIFYMSKEKEKEGIESLKQNASKIDIVAPQFYLISTDLNISGSVSQDIKNIAKEKKIKIMPLVMNSKFMQGIMHDLLASKTAQKRVIDFMVKEAKANNFIGWQFDFENINYKDRGRYSQFIEKTAESFHKNNLILSVAVVVRNNDFEDNDFYKNWSGVFDYKRIAKVCDFVSIMTYDDPESKGPVASLDFINESLTYLKYKISAEKLSLGIPLYYWEWALNPLVKITRDGTNENLDFIKETFNSFSVFFKEMGSAALIYFDKSQARVVWHEDEKSFISKLDIAEKNNFRGFSAWVLGIEDPKIWGGL